MESSSSEEMSSPQRSRVISKITNFIYRTDDYTCLTLFRKSCAITFALQPHDTWQLGDTKDIFQVDEPEVAYQMKVIHIDRAADFIVLKSQAGNVQDTEPTLCLPSIGSEYFQLGLSATSQLDSPLSLSKGVITSLKFNRNGHVLGSAGSHPGDSGGGCFGVETGLLYGINVGNDCLGITGNTTLTDLGTRYPARSHIVPSNLFALFGNN
jgi:hypothetical protein